MRDLTPVATVTRVHWSPVISCNVLCVLLYQTAGRQYLSDMCDHVNVIKCDNLQCDLFYTLNILRKHEHN